MHLTRCQDQKSETLDEFYATLAQGNDQVSREAGSAMLDLIARLRELPDERRVYGLTSHYRLCLLAGDTWQSPWFVIIATLNTQNYYVEYRLPDALAPWPNAYVKGEARSLDEAVKMIVVAMEKSEGWSTLIY